MLLILANQWFNIDVTDLEQTNQCTNIFRAGDPVTEVTLLSQCQLVLLFISTYMFLLKLSSPPTML